MRHFTFHGEEGPITSRKHTLYYSLLSYPTYRYSNLSGIQVCQHEPSSKAQCISRDSVVELVIWIIISAIGGRIENICCEHAFESKKDNFIVKLTSWQPLKSRLRPSCTPPAPIVKDSHWSKKAENVMTRTKITLEFIFELLLVKRLQGQLYLWRLSSVETNKYFYRKGVLFL